MESIIKNYQILHELWEKAADIIRDTETIASVRGVASQMSTFYFFFGISISVKFYCDTLIISVGPYRQPCSASEGQIIADMTKRTLQGLQTD